MSEEGPDGRQQEIRLTPPPRVEPVGAKLGRRRANPVANGPAIAPPARHGRPRWVAPAAFGLLVLIGVAAFYLMRVGSSPTPTTAADDVEEVLVPSRIERRAGANAPEPKAEGAPAPAAATSNAGAGFAPPRIESRTGSSPAATDPPPTRPAPANRGTAFGRAMAEGLAAVDAGDFATAREAFARAAAIDPASPEPAAGLARVEAAASLIEIEELLASASELLAAEAWREATAAYRAALAIDPTLTFARRGLDVAEARGALSERLAYHLERPERLSAEEVLSEVDRLLETAREVESAGPRHAAQVAALEELADRVRRPVRVSLLSDDRTAVTVYQVGSLGTFARRELELRPGTYTVVGSRAGYRDVRRQLKVEPGRTPEPFEIRCEEKI